ncbi:Uncharacterized protein TCAP_06757 [Tolypocladium capitatum]|uniref:Uncharacterized protein n=1 Tax=Tolypocladium capitatum TaxID=45235 RepID=A0A2K3Q6U5_9HYPO|nr:Uncharacterized protein TCAP_06757 [Tolypocladium capitatum]
MCQCLDQALRAPVELPYLRAAAELPGPLPPPDGLRDASKSELSPRRSFWDDGGGMCLIRGIYVVKFGATVTENEGHALLFVEKHANISAPRLYAMYRDPPSGPLHLVMEYIQSVDLESLWNSLSVEAKSWIAAQIQPMLAQMCSFSPPHDFIGGVCGGGVPDPIFRTDLPNSSINGPFRTAEEVGSALALASRSNWEQNGRHGWISSFFSRHLAAARKDHGVNFTHGDLHMRNILVEKVLTESMPESAGVKAAESDQRWSYQVRGLGVGRVVSRVLGICLGSCTISLGE